MASIMSFSNQSLARRLKLQQLAVFERVLSCGSLLAASRELHMTQPAITKIVQELEEHFGQTLLVRSRRGVQPTDFGLMLRNHCRTLMANLRYLADDLNSCGAGVSGQVVVGTLLAASAQLLPGAVMRLREMAPNVIVQVRVGVNDKMFPELARGELDVVVGLIPLHEKNSEYEHVPLYAETLCAVVGRQHPLAASRTISVAQLESWDWILPTSESEASHSVDHFFEALKMRKPTRIVESVSIMTNLGLLVDSNMIAIMPYKVAGKFVHLGLLNVLPVGQDIAFGYVGYTLAKGRAASPATQRLLLSLHDVASHMAT
jgi:DNA-binding transcriptional LysR family regulator